MSLNKNLKFSDYKEVIIQNDKAGDKILLTDLINNSGSSPEDKVIASIFLIAKYKSTDAVSFLVLKPKCLWLNYSGGTLKDNNDSSTSIAKFQDYKDGDVIKASFLSKSDTVKNILTSRGISNIDKIYGLPNVFMFDLNEFNRIRNAAISITGNSNLNSVWL